MCLLLRKYSYGSNGIFKRNLCFFFVQNPRSHDFKVLFEFLYKILQRLVLLFSFKENFVAGKSMLLNFRFFDWQGLFYTELNFLELCN